MRLFSRAKGEQPVSQAPTPSELPPPGDIMHHMLRAAGILPPEPDKPNAFLEKLYIDKPGFAPVVDDSPMSVLHKQIVQFFDRGTEEASVKFAALQMAVQDHQTMIRSDAFSSMRSEFAEKIPWNSCKLAATLVLILAAPNDSQMTYEALKFLNGKMGGLPTMAVINDTPTAGLSMAFAKAKKAAIDGKIGAVTVLGVSLADVEMIERGEQRDRDMKYTSFAHTFVLGISRTGWRLYQAWGKYGYRLDQWFAKGGAQTRDWKAAKAFLKTFSRLEAAKGSWSKQINDDYEECFDVDILKICGKEGPSAPIVPKYRPWVRIFAIEDVKASNLEKFTWV